LASAIDVLTGSQRLGHGVRAVANRLDRCDAATLTLLGC
jgi:hypothetical protein